MASIAPDVIDTLSTWEELADAGRVVAQDMDSGRFLLGDVANRCARVYGKDSVGKLADEIRVAKRQTLYEYAKVAARFQYSARAEFQELGMTFSHFRTAMRAGDDAELWLTRAADEGWPVAALHRELAAALGKPVPPLKLIDAEGVVLDCADGHATLYVEAAHALTYRQRVRVVVYAAEGAA